jgi:hypothetical protein
MWHVRVLQLLSGATTGQTGSSICLTNSLQKVCRDTLRAAASRRLSVARLLQLTPYLPPLVLPMIGSLQCAFQAGLGISMHAHIMCSAVQCCAVQCNRAPHRGSSPSWTYYQNDSPTAAAFNIEALATACQRQQPHPGSSAGVVFRVHFISPAQIGITAKCHTMAC